MMAKHRYIPSGILFDGDDEHDKDEINTNKFRSRIPRPLSKTSNQSRNSANMELQKQHKIQKIQEIEKKTIESTTRSLNILQQTGEIGFHAARELSRQGEQLQKTNVMLDDIDSNLKQSEKELHGIKSVLHGFKNIITLKSRSPSPCRHSPNKKSPKIGKSTFYGLDDFLSAERDSSTFAQIDLQSLPKSPSSQEVDGILEANLGAMASHIAQFKDLGVAMGKELDRQNELIDLVHDKMERADIKIGEQNKDMNKILGN